MTVAGREPGFSELIHAPTRLSLLSLLSAAESADFGTLRDALGLTDSALSKQVATLEAAGLVDVERVGRGRAQRVWIRLSPQGRQRFEAHLSVLRSIVDRSSAVRD